MLFSTPISSILNLSCGKRIKKGILGEQHVLSLSCMFLAKMLLVLFKCVELISKIFHLFLYINERKATFVSSTYNMVSMHNVHYRRNLDSLTLSKQKLNISSYLFLHISDNVKEAITIIFCNYCKNCIQSLQSKQTKD